jgi:hypothetical protein
MGYFKSFYWQMPSSTFGDNENHQDRIEPGIFQIGSISANYLFTIVGKKYYQIANAMQL